MRSFLHCWGRQEPSLLCPAVAASPPPLSAFHSSPSSTTTILPEPATLFTNIDRQLLSASLTASVGVGQQQQQQPSPPQVSPQNQQSPPSAPETVAAAIASTIQNQQFPSPPSATTASATPLPIPNSSNHLLAVAAATVAAAQQQSPQQQQQQTNIPQSSPAQKGLDAFFAALANANGPNNNNGSNGQNGTTIPPQTSAVGMPNNATGQIFSGGSEATATTNPLASLIGANENSANNANQQAPGTTTQQQQLAETLQTAATNAIANAVNAVNAVTFMNAAIAVQQQQIQQQQTQQVAAAAAVAAAPLLNTLATLKQQQSQPSLLQSAHQNNNDQIAAVTNANASAALNNALQLAAAQSAIQQQKQSSNLLEQSPQQQQQLRGGPLSPEGIVQAGLPALLRLTVPNIIRPGPSQSKPIPLLEDKVDLLRFKRKEPREWSSDDVVAWILDVARRHQIPCENLNLAKFASCNGPLLMLMNEQSFKENDLTYGSLLFSEFCKLITDENFIDEWMRTTGAGGECSTSNMAGSSCHQPVPPPQTIINLPQMQQQQMPSTASNLLAANLATLQQYNEQQAGPSSASTVIQQIPQQSQQQQSNLLLAAAAGIAAVQQHQQQQQKTISTFGHHQLLPPPTAIPSANSALLGLQPHQANNQMHAPQPIASLSKMLQQNPQMPPGNNRQQQQMMMASTSGAVPMSSTAGMRMMRKVPVEQKIRRNKDGRPRKRSQHTKGNKLWEFIRDALKDPRTCPSIVRWEDPSEGVFRIVESERLAFLWGQKKNNQKMTYEKLSRAMRTYYEKEILVPVPKSGLYPKKLVYKFGPSAMGWKMAASMAVQSQLALLPNPHQHHHLHRI